MAADNKKLGEFELTNIPPAPRNVPKIEVTFDIDANGIVAVSAKDKGTNKEQSITVKSGGGLSDEEIERMIREAEANAEADKTRRQFVEEKNNASTLADSIERQLEEYKDKISTEIAEEIASDIQNLREIVESANDEADTERIVEAKDKLNASASKIGEAMYSGAGGDESSSEGQEKQSGDDEPIDAEYTEKK
jgi:molecular chaperone DnaK